MPGQRLGRNDGNDFPRAPGIGQLGGHGRRMAGDGLAVGAERVDVLAVGAGRRQWQLKYQKAHRREGRAVLGSRWLAWQGEAGGSPAAAFAPQRDDIHILALYQGALADQRFSQP
ncbi:hypothetical protein D3C78_1524250 [compost metagenome]